MIKFEDFNLKEVTRQLIAANSFKEPTPIQEEIIPPALKGKDLIGLSVTGSGKTHAYLIPICEKLNPSEDRVQAVVTAGLFFFHGNTSSGFFPPLNPPVAEIQTDIGEHHDGVQNIEPERQIQVVRQQFGGDAEQIADKDEEQEQQALSFGRAGGIRFVD